MRAKSGFTLVEILIVVVILGILAAIVIPQFTSASVEAKESALVSNLQSIRSQIELYKIHHNDALPGTQSGSPDFETAMTTKTDQYGDPGGRFGPYMQKIPDNPFSGAIGNENTVTDGVAATAPGDDSSGWWFVTSGADAGLFQANDGEVNPFDGNTPHIDY